MKASPLHRRFKVFIAAVTLPWILIVSPVAAAPAGPKVGEVSPLFSAADTTGQRYSLDQALAKGRTTVILFWNLRSAPCLKEMVYLEEAYRQYREKGLLVLAVEANRSDNQQVGESLEKLRNIEMVPSYPIIADPDGRLLNTFGVSDAPTTFIISRDGVISYRLDNFSVELKSELEARIQEAFFPKTGREAAGGPAISGTPAESAPVQGEAPSIKKDEEAKRAAIPSAREDFEKNRYFGDFYFNRREYERAIPYYEKCVALDPQSIYVRLKMGALYVELKNFNKAREMWEAVLRLDPGNEEADTNIRRLIRGDY